ncbi:hypothetical protein GCM10023159_09490 [Brevibacterium yomogidense]
MACGADVVNAVAPQDEQDDERPGDPGSPAHGSAVDADNPSQGSYGHGEASFTVLQGWWFGAEPGSSVFMG